MKEFALKFFPSIKRHVWFCKTPTEDVLTLGKALNSQKSGLNVKFLHFFQFNGPLWPAGSGVPIQISDPTESESGTETLTFAHLYS
jgi:hypothetical protein